MMLGRAPGLAHRLGAAARRTVSTLKTSPGSTLHVTGATPRLIVKTNMETYVATLEAGTADVSAWASADGDDLHVRAALSDGVTTVAVPASFNIVVDMETPCDVDVDGWFEGSAGPCARTSPSYRAAACPSSFSAAFLHACLAA